MPNHNVSTIRSDNQIRLLQRENELTNSIIQGASDAIYAKDLEGRYISINVAGAAFFNKPEIEIIGCTDAELLGAQAAEPISNRDKEVFETGQAVTYKSTTLFRTGSRYFSTTKSPMHDTSGKVIGLIGISRDITTEHLFEKKYKSIFDYAPFSFWEEDFSKVKLFLDELQAKGITNLKEYFQDHPEQLEKCIDLIEVRNVNRTTLEMYGVADKDAFIQKIDRNFTPNSESIFINEFVALAKGETFFQSEGSIVNLNGKQIDVQFNLNVLPGHEHDLSMVLVSIVDISDTKELNIIKDRYQSIVETQSEMICRVNPKGTILFRNHAFTRFFEFKDAGKDMRFLELFPPPELERCEKALQKLSPRTHEQICELRNYDKQGNLVWQEWSITAFYSTSGTLLGYQAVGNDITKRKIAQDALASSEARWRSVFEHADDLIMTVNAAGYILSVNDYKEIPAGDKWAGRTLHEVLSPHNATNAMHLISSVFASKKTLKTEFKLHRKQDNNIDTFGVALSPIFHGSRVITVVCIARNINETKAFEKRHREALIEGQENERMRVSQELHDGLGQLFTAIKLNLQELKESIKNKQEPHHIQQNVTVLEENIGIAFSEVKNISKNLMPDVLRQFGLQPALKDLVDKWNATVDLDIQLELVDVNKRFSADLEKAIFRMCQELINNSVRHGKAHKIYVQILNHEDSLVLMVEDDGVGFEPTQVKTGFGLRNIWSRAEVFEGHVTIDSAPNQGTVTTIEIPLKNLCLR